MIPSTVAHEITRALHDFLATVLNDFLAQPENLVKGPYLTKQADCWRTSSA